MLKRTIYIGNPSYLQLKNQQLEIKKTKDELIGKIPIEDMAILLLDHPQITITNALISHLQSHKVVIINCNEKHIPLGFMLPCTGHTQYSAHVQAQISASEPLKKQLWKQIINAKIKNQKELLKQNELEHEPMQNYLDKLSSGDMGNMEGNAANHYWKNLFINFRRERFGNAPNNMLNYGYAILRAIVARALVSSGLLLVTGIHHKNKYNAYCLADDIMEPYRPFVDQMVYEFIENNFYPEELDKDIKAYLLQIATEDVSIDGKNRPLIVAVSTTTASLVKCFKGEIRHIILPKFPSYAKQI